MNVNFNLLETRFCKFLQRGTLAPGIVGTTMRQIFLQLAKSKRGATAIEYGLIVALVAIACMTAINSTASGTIAMWEYVKTNIVPKTD